MTCEAAAALNMEDVVGSLEEGKRADIILLDKTDPTLCPRFGDQGLVSNLIYSFRGQADMVIIEGEIVVENRSVKADLETASKTLQNFCAIVTDEFRKSH